MSISAISAQRGLPPEVIAPPLSPTPSSSPASPRPDPEEQRKQQEIQKLQQRDAQVRRHEAAHVAAAGPYARGGASFEYVTGPDGRRYAVGGEVSIDLSKVPNDPEATIRKMQTVKRAALAPADPSAQDRQIAAQADRIAMEARQEIAKREAQEPQGYTNTAAKATPTPEAIAIDVII